MSNNMHLKNKKFPAEADYRKSLASHHLQALLAGAAVMTTER